MNKNKTLYQQPSCDILELRFEGMVCTSPTNERMNSTSMDGTWDMDE